jgi:hypothetical protein
VIARKKDQNAQAKRPGARDRADEPVSVHPLRSGDLWMSSVEKLLASVDAGLLSIRSFIKLRVSV